MYTVPADCDGLVASDDVGRIVGELTDVIVNDGSFSALECTYSSGFEGDVTFTYDSELQLSIRDLSEGYQAQGRRYLPGLGEAAFFTEASPDTDPPAAMLSILFGQSIVTISSEEVTDPDVFVQLGEAALDGIDYRPMANADPMRNRPVDPLSAPGGCENLVGGTVELFFPGLSEVVETRYGDVLLECAYTDADDEEWVTVAWKSIPDADLQDFHDAWAGTGVEPTPGLGDAAYFDAPSPASPDSVPEMIVRVGDVTMNILTRLSDDPEVFSELGKMILDQSGYDK
ncbi:hypothetical protein [Mycetocola sp. 2940]|uniref:hypothetical protein n=1 Tax=Mycetocola sp. 2940 TaxID=3156452 RepID=UPI003393C72D